MFKLDFKDRAEIREPRNAEQKRLVQSTAELIARMPKRKESFAERNERVKRMLEDTRLPRSRRHGGHGESWGPTGVVEIIQSKGGL